MPSAPNSFILSLPKADLHLHLEGSIDSATWLELRKRHGKTGTLSEIDQLYQYENFSGFLMAFKTVTEDLQSPEDYELITYRLMEKLKAENVQHAEVYVSVGVCLWRKQDFDAIFEGLERGRAEGGRQGHVDRVAAVGHQHAADPGDVVPGVEGVPAAAEVGLEPGAEVHRQGGRGDADVAEVAGRVAGRDVQAAAERDR